MSTGELSPNSSLSPSVTPNGYINNQVPKYGTVIPNRIFVGGIATNTTDQELKAYFSSFGAVKDTKIICDRAGVSKGYGFVTFETQEDAEKIIKKDAENLIFKDRKLNIGPAVRKQQAFPRLIDGLSTVTGGATMLITPPYGYTSPAGLTVMPSADVSGYQALQQQVQPQVAANYSNTMMIPQPVYMSQPHYQFAATPIHTQAAAMQYSTQHQWVSARCYQPATVTSANGNYLYAPELIYASAAASAAAPGNQQVLELTDGTLLDHQGSASETDARALNSSSSKECCNIDTTQQVQQQQLASILYGRSIQTPIHSSASAQPPPVKKMAPMQAHHVTAGTGTHAVQLGQRCYTAPMVVKAGTVQSAKPTIIATNQCPATPRLQGVNIAYMPTPAAQVEDMRVKFEHDGHLAASIAPPTPPSTPAAASST